MKKNVSSSNFLLMVLAVLLPLAELAVVRAFPSYDYGGKTHQQFLTDALEHSSPGNARLLAELFGGLELGLELGGGTQAVISVGGAATRCQHQSPCYDAECRLCYDPLLRIHGKCGGASYFTCAGTLPKGCLPFSCTARAGRNFNPDKLKTAVFVKKFPRYQDPFCLEQNNSRGSRGRSSKEMDPNATEVLTTTTPSPVSSLEYHPRDSNPSPASDPTWVLTVPDAITPCQSFDLCLDLKCGMCFDPYLGAHTTCGKMTYYDCQANLPLECRPLKCSETNIKELFPLSKTGEKEDASETGEKEETEETSPLMVRNFSPMVEGKRNCI